ncbi:MAG: hypothetical protein PVF66_10890 [Candidatus Aminicenantes bacterium]
MDEATSEEFSLPESFFEGTRRRRARGLYEKAQDSGLRKHATFDPASQKRLGFRLRSPHLFGEEPCPLRLQTVFSPTALRLRAEKVEEGMG